MPLVSALLFMTLVLFVFVQVWSGAAIRYEIERDLLQEIRNNLKFVRVEDGELVYLDGFVWQEDGISFLMMNTRNEVLSGEYPAGFEGYDRSALSRTRVVWSGGGVYYLRDVQRIKELGTEYMMRGVVSRESVSSRYLVFKYLSYLSIALIFGVIIFLEFVLSRRISNSLKEMCQTAERIGQEADVSQRIEYDSRFYELSVLAEAENRMLRRFEQIIKEQEQFTSDAAHELKTPVAVILAQCEQAKRQSVDAAKQREAIAVIDRQAGRISRMITQLLRLSRLEQGQCRMKLEEFDLAEVVQMICEEMQEREENGADFELHLCEARVRGDLGLVVTAIQNLLTNAGKFSEMDGKIEVETGKREGRAFVSVHDYGCGISEDKLALIFRRFYKEDESRNTEGTGLGLPLALKIAEKHGGTITAASRKGEGSTFVLFLPALL